MKNNKINPKHKEFMKHFLKNVAPTLSTGEKEILNSLVKKANQKRKIN
tara:strand:- start:2192 stop:2335 length:144 start_codon:yes stop_codon:yes gene_type:complete